nr:hypothetical protein [Tanacetum cinerariifolium]
LFVKMDSTTVKRMYLMRSKIEVAADKIVEYGVTNKQAVMFVPSIELADKLYAAISKPTINL